MTAAAIPTVLMVIVRYTEVCQSVWKFCSPHTRSICDDSSLSCQNAVTSISASDAR